MRQAAEERVWRRLQKRRGTEAVRKVTLESGQDLEVTAAGMIVGGLNGSGKTRLLTTIDATQSNTLLLRLHELCEVVRKALASPHDLGELIEEVGPLDLDATVVSHVERVIGRDYDSVNWYALQFDPDPDYIQRFSWDGEEVIVPYFAVSHDGTDYSSLEMGLGELSVHLLFWIIDQYKTRENLLLLLDEPDAYLPARTARRLLHRLVEVSETRGWTIVMTTHSEAVITEAIDHDLFVLVRREGGQIQAHSSRHEGPTIADDLLANSRPSIVAFTEDESAAALLKALLATSSLKQLRDAEILWKDGHGYVRTLAKTMPKPPRIRLKVLFVLDGDQRSGEAVEPWPIDFLPTMQDPDYLFRTLRIDPTGLAMAASANDLLIRRALDALEGSDDHDWVNGLCERVGDRQTTLRGLAKLWVSSHPEESREFVSKIEARC